MIPIGANVAAGAAVAAAIAQAIKASGAIVRIEPSGFEQLLRRQESPLVVHHYGGFLSKKHQYLSSYKGLAFHTQSLLPLDLPARSELIEVGAIWIPG